MRVLAAVGAMPVYVVPQPRQEAAAVARGGRFGRPCQLGDLESAAARAALSAHSFRGDDDLLRAEGGQLEEHPGAAGQGFSTVVGTGKGDTGAGA